MASQSNRLDALLNDTPVIPVLTINDVTSGVETARALIAGGLRVIEVTLRTEVALEAIQAIADELPDAIVGAGTLTEPHHFAQTQAAGATFTVSPAVTPALIEAAADHSPPWLPTASTPSESLSVLAAGFGTQKLFPAEPLGGIGYLKALHPPLPDVRFCPTGGINARNAADYLACPNVICVGGSWLAPADAVASADWLAISALARDAARLRGSDPSPAS
ncbi:MAG: bifunctional 4-hydroxy-2-oxoglutarate aldolase/2-dehydro-3-deoxy-phosphogluconate aldolase [Pseudomonadota bacterium]